MGATTPMAARTPGRWAAPFWCVIALSGCPGVTVGDGPGVEAPATPLPCADFDQDGQLAEACGGDDCDDLSASVVPGGTERCNAVDDDCNGAVDDGLDEDGDGFLGCQDGAPDCDDSDPRVNPGEIELCNGQDDDCDGAIDQSIDEDLDGYLGCTEGAPDCDDHSSSVHPGAPEACNGLDDNCDGEIDEGLAVDADGDGWLACSPLGSLDCDDDNPEVYPGAVEACDGIDGDCFGMWGDETSDIDEDGVVYCADCNDLDPSIGEVEPCPTFYDDLDLADGSWMAIPPLSGLDLGAVTATEDYSYLELRDVSEYSEFALTTTGVLCGDAASVPACQAAYASVDREDVWGWFCGMGWPAGRQLVWTRGDLAGEIGSMDLAGFLGGLDSPEEVALWLDRSGYYTSPPQPGTAVRRVADGWEAIVIEVAWLGPVRMDRLLLHISVDGTITELDRWIASISFGEDWC